MLSNFTNGKAVFHYLLRRSYVLFMIQVAEKEITEERILEIMKAFWLKRKQLLTATQMKT